MPPDVIPSAGIPVMKKMFDEHAGQKKFWDAICLQPKCMSCHVKLLSALWIHFASGCQQSRFGCQQNSQIGQLGTWLGVN